MKKFLSVYGGVLFLFVSLRLILEEPFPSSGYSMFNTLYNLNGASTILDYFKNVYNLSPLAMSLIYILVLIGIIKSRKQQKFYIAVTLGNLILSIPIFMVHKDTLFFRPFYYSHGNVCFANIAKWVWYIYLSILGVIILLIYLFFQSEKFTTKQKNIMKKAIKITLISLAVIFLINTAISIYVSFKVDNLIKDSCNSRGQVNTNPECISDRDFRCLNYLDSRDCGGKHSFPITLTFFNHAQSRYWYERSGNYGTSKSSFNFPIIVSLELKDFKWVVTYVRSLP